MARISIPVAINLAFTRPIPDLLEQAARTGRENGRDHDWTPGSLEEAVFELLCYAWQKGDSGLVILWSRDPRPPHVFTLKVDIDLLVSPQEVMIEAEPFLGEVMSLEDALTFLMTAEASPADFGFEIHDIREPQSNHDKAESLHMAHLAVTPFAS